jgi:hypothetical protein
MFDAGRQSDATIRAATIVTVEIRCNLMGFGLEFYTTNAPLMIICTNLHAVLVMD